MSRKSYGEGTLSKSKILPTSQRRRCLGADKLDAVAELILVSISYLFLVNALIDLWQYHVETANVNDGRGSEGWGANGMVSEDELKREHKHERKMRWVPYVAW